MFPSLFHFWDSIPHKMSVKCPSSPFQLKEGKMGLFDTQIQSFKLDELNDPLLKLSELIDFELFRPLLDRPFQKDHKSNAGRKPFDRVMLFKGLILQRLYNLSDDQLEFQTTDRLSFRRFLKLAGSEFSPDSKTFWAFRETLTQHQVLKEAFYLFEKFLCEKGYTPKGGTLIDATFIEVPKQRNTREQNKEIKEGWVPEDFKKNKHKLAQKDMDSRWVKKNEVSYYGYKDHPSADVGYKIIRDFEVTSAAVHDSNEFSGLLTQKNDTLTAFADSAYYGEKISKALQDAGIKEMIVRKGYRNKPLTEEDKIFNKAVSRIRARIEHVFATITQFGGTLIRSIGIVRARGQIALINLVYNMKRFMFLETQRQRQMA